jgi:hypothetical protein
MKKRVLKSRVHEIMKRKMPTCYFNGVTSRFMEHIPAEVVKLYDWYTQIRFDTSPFIPFVLSRMIEESIKAGQRMLPRKAKDWERRTCATRSSCGPYYKRRM